MPLGGKSLQYASATGTGQFGANSGQATELPAVTLEPGQYFLVRQAGGTTGAPFTADFTDPTAINMSGSEGKVALADGTTSLGCNGGTTTCDAGQLARIIDLVGYGGASFFEGTGAAPRLTNFTAAARVDGGCRDNDDNRADFELANPPVPRNGETQKAPCVGDSAPSVASSTPARDAIDVPLDGGMTVKFSEPVAAAASAFSLACASSGAHDVAVSGGPTSFGLDAAGTFARGERCTLTIEADGVSDLDGQDPPDAMGSDAAISSTTVGQELRIREIQGAGHVSPHLNAVVSNVEGVVTARRGNGFFMQDAQEDSDDGTSEGIFVFTGGAPAASVVAGKAVRVSGRVAEFRQGNRPADLTLTQIIQSAVTVEDGEGADIDATLLGAGGRVPPSEVIDDHSLGNVEINSFFDPREDGIDFYESVEGMLVQVNEPRAVGPTAAPNIGELPVVADAGRNADPFTARGGLIIAPCDFNPERLHLDDEVLKTLSNPFPRMPLADVGDTLADVEAVVGYSFSNFKLQVTSQPTIDKDGGLQKETTEAPDENQLSVGSFNVENLTPPGSNPSPAQVAKYAALADTLVKRMQAPDVVAVEEVQDNNGTSGTTDSPVVDASQTWESLIGAIEDAGGPSYDYCQIDPVAHQDGGQPGGSIRVGFLFRTDAGWSSSIAATPVRPTRPRWLTRGTARS